MFAQHIFRGLPESSYVSKSCKSLRDTAQLYIQNPPIDLQLKNVNQSSDNTSISSKLSKLKKWKNYKRCLVD